MIRYLTTAFLTLCVTGFAFADCDIADLDRQIETITPKEQLKTVDIHRLSETFGNMIGKDLKNQGLDLNLEDIAKGIKEGAAGHPSPMKSDEYADIMDQLRQQGFQELAAHNLALANAFMACNAKSEGIVEAVPRKVQFKVLKPGTGPVIGEDSTPLMHYSARYLDGTLFGSSEEMGGPIAVPLGQMVTGFRKGVAGMREGEKRRIFVHPDLAYGVISEIPPNSLLVFEVEAIVQDDTSSAAQSEPQPVAIPVEEPKKVEEPQEEADLTLDAKEEDDFSTKPLLLAPVK